MSDIPSKFSAADQRPAEEVPPGGTDDLLGQAAGGSGACAIQEGVSAEGAPASAGAQPICAICQSPLAPEDSRMVCPSCQAPYHEDCWHENGGCGIYGCSQVPEVEPRRSIEIPVSYWGQEHKPCPACGQEILAAAVRCRHCGATFASAQPQDANTFQQRTALEQRLPRLRNQVVWMFICSVLPFSAPIGGIWALVFYPSYKQEFQALPSIYTALCKIAMVVGLGQTAVLVIMGVLYGLKSGV